MIMEKRDMKKVLFLTNYPSPYRVRFFDELAKYVDVTVLFADRKEKQKHRNMQWYIQGEGRFQAVQLEKHLVAFGRFDLCTDVLPWLKKEFDEVVVCGYSNPTMILAMLYMRLHRIPFCMEVDGGLIRQDSKPKYLVKKFLVTLANRWLSTGKQTTRYLVHYGAKADSVTEYPFSSLMSGDILSAPVPKQEKKALREELGVPESQMVLAIGQFIHRKGFDVLMHSAKSLSSDVGVYIIGAEAPGSYLRLREELGADNVHFKGFQTKEQLTKFYKASDLFVLPTREDIWGLVINESLAHGLPTITTDRCVAGLELVEDGVNGYIVPVDDAAALAEKIQAVLDGDLEAMGSAALEKVRPYTVENMAKAHSLFFGQQFLQRD